MASAAGGPAQDLPLPVRLGLDGVDAALHPSSRLHTHSGPRRESAVARQSGEGDRTAGDAHAEGAGAAAQGGRQAEQHDRLAEHAHVDSIAPPHFVYQSAFLQEISL